MSARVWGRIPPRRSTLLSRATLAGPKDTFVTINNDTVYSIAQLDLSVGPVALHVPDTGWPLLRPAVRRRVDEQLRLRRPPRHRYRPRRLPPVPPGWGGDAPAGAHGHPVPTTVASIVGRWAVGGRRRPSRRARPAGRQFAHPAGPRGDAHRPSGARPARCRTELVFLEKLRVWSQQFPPADATADPAGRPGAAGHRVTGASPYTFARR